MNRLVLLVVDRPDDLGGAHLVVTVCTLRPGHGIVAPHQLQRCERCPVGLPGGLSTVFIMDAVSRLGKALTADRLARRKAPVSVVDAE
jgi:hypothetical protein